MLTGLMFAMLIFDDQVLVMTNGAELTCDDYQRRTGLVLIRKGRELYSLPAEEVDWSATENRRQADAEAAEAPQEHHSNFTKLDRNSERLPDFIVEKLDVKDASLVDVLRFLTDMADLNLVIDSSVIDSKATYFFKKIPWRTAFEIVIRNAGLDYEWLYGAVRIRPLL